MPLKKKQKQTKRNSETKKKKPEKIPIRFPDRFFLVGCDFSLKRPGFFKCLATKDENGYAISDAYVSCVDNKTKVKPHGMILSEIIFKMAEFFPDPDFTDIPIFFVREKAINSRGAMSEIGIFKVVGIADVMLYNMTKGYGGKEWEEVYPVTVKKRVTGDSKAEKQKVAECLPAFVGNIDYENDDESDAAAVAVAFLLENGITPHAKQ